jgi:nicotinamide riboside kinase
MIRAGVIGAPGAGKTSLCRSVTGACRREEKLKRIELVSEYARRYISKHGPVDEIWEQYRIMEKQIEWEDSIPPKKTDLLLTDSPVHLGFLYACDVTTNRPKDIMVYNDIFKKLSKLNEGKPRYDVIFHLPPKIMAVDDGVRAPEHLKQERREATDAQLKFIFNLLFKPARFITIEPTDLGERADIVIETLKSLI